MACDLLIGNLDLWQRRDKFLESINDGYLLLSDGSTCAYSLRDLPSLTAASL